MGFGDLRKRLVQVIGGLNRRCMQLQGKGFCRRCRFIEPDAGFPVLRRPEHGHAGHLGQSLFKDLQSLATQVRQHHVRPVTLPPGCARLLASPISNGLPLVITIGIVWLALRAASALIDAVVTMTSTLFPNQLGGELIEPILFAFGIAVFETDILALRYSRARAGLA